MFIKKCLPSSTVQDNIDNQIIFKNNKKKNHKTF